jgi:hypothetical protein
MFDLYEFQLQILDFESLQADLLTGSGGRIPHRRDFRLCDFPSSL